MMVMLLRALLFAASTRLSIGRTHTGRFKPEFAIVTVFPRLVNRP